MASFWSVNVLTMLLIEYLLSCYLLLQPPPDQAHTFSQASAACWAISAALAMDMVFSGIVASSMKSSYPTAFVLSLHPMFVLSSPIILGEECISTGRNQILPS